MHATLHPRRLQVRTAAEWLGLEEVVQMQIGGVPGEAKRHDHPTRSCGCGVWAGLRRERRMID